MAFALNYPSLSAEIQSYTHRVNDQAFINSIDVFILFAQRKIARELKILGMQEYVIGTFTANSGVITKPGRWLETINMFSGGLAGVVYTTKVTNGGSGYQVPPIITGGTGTQYLGYLTNGVLTQVGVVAGGTGNAAGPFALTIAPAPDDTTGAGATATASAYVGNNVAQPILPRVLEYCQTYWPNSVLTGNPKFYAEYDFAHWLIVPTPVAALPITIGYFQVANLIDAFNQTNWITDNAPDLLLYACLVEAYTFLENVDKIAYWQGKYTEAKAGFATEDDRRVADRSVTRKPAMMPAAPPAGPGGPR